MPQPAIAPRVLLVGLMPGTGNLHLPRHLARAGLAVVFVGTPACMASRSGHVRTAYPWPSDGGGLAVGPFIDSVRRAQPSWVVPLDELAAQVLQQIGIGQLAGGDRPLPADVVDLVRRSLGDSASYPLFTARRCAYDTAQAAGILMAPQAIANSLDACLAFAQVHGYPLVLKRETSSGGVGAHILDSEAAMTALVTSDIYRQAGRAWVIQRYIPGALGMHAVFAERGRVMAKLSAVQITRRSNRTTAPSSVVKLLQHEAMAASGAAFVAATGASGFHGWDFQLDEGGSAVMIEHNPRPISISHLGYWLGDDLCAALALACGVSPGKPTVRGRGHQVALFPDDW